MIQRKTIFTVGHSNQELADFIRLLQLHDVTALADVRSHPTSRFEQYRKESLQESLPAAGVKYVFLGKELGARRDEPECYVDGQVDFERVARLPTFLEGIARLERGAAEHTIALMCAEREPLHCHRTILVARNLVDRDWDVQHILTDGSLEPHTVTEQRMMDHVGGDPLFDAQLSAEQLRRRAYCEYAQGVAYRRPQSDV